MDWNINEHLYIICNSYITSKVLIQFGHSFSRKYLGTFFNQREIWGIYIFPCMCWMLSRLVIPWQVEHASNTSKHPAWRIMWLLEVWEWHHLLLALGGVLLIPLLRSLGSRLKHIYHQAFLWLHVNSPNQSHHYLLMQWYLGQPYFGVTVLTDLLNLEQSF